jgi:CubicO group peptidase (beta-lactamase class C family)
MERTVDDGSHAGYVLLLARDGKIVDWRAYGHRDAVARRPMAKDDLFRIFSMTKLFTSVAALCLMEEGRIQLDDPVCRYLPALRSPKVLASGASRRSALVAAEREVTIRDLLTHTSGYTYGDNCPAAFAPVWKRVNPLAAQDLAELVARTAKLPLAHQPGTAFQYGISTDLLGALIEQVSGQSLDAFFQQWITRPLGLEDTGFWVPEEKRDRLALIHQRGPGASLALETTFNRYWPTATRGLRQGGAGLFSTAADCVRFAQMLLDGGQLGGVRILSRKSVELMTQNHLSALAQPHPMGNRWEGFGLGVRVTTDLGQSPTLGSLGAFGWNGMATTLVQIDPRERLVAMALYQHLPYNEENVFGLFINGAYAAIER